LRRSSDDGIVVVMGGRVMSERPTVWGELPPDGTVLTTSEYLQTAESLRVQELIFGTLCIAPLDVILDPARALIVQPDLFFVSRLRQEIITDRIWGAPDLVVEVMSPHPRIGKLQDRLEYFSHYGVRECWLMHQLTKEFEVLELTPYGVQSRRTFSGVARIQSAVLRDFALSPAVLSCW
jgi:hypothetical protein